MTNKRNALRKSNRQQQPTFNERAKEQVLLHRQIAKKSMRQLLQAPGSTAMTVSVIAIALLLPALLFLVGSNLSGGLAGIETNAKLTAYMELAATESEISDVSNYLHTVYSTESIQFISSEQALSEFSQGSGLGPVLSQLPANPLPAAFVVTPSPAFLGNVDTMISELQNLAGVEFVQLDRLWIQRLQAIIELLTAFNQVLMILVGAGLLLIVGNTIRLAIEHRRQEIQVIKLVGGSNNYIARPFLYTGLFLGLAGGLAAGLLVSLIGLFLTGAVNSVVDLYGSNWRLPGPSVLDFLILIAIGGGIGWLAALVSSYKNIAAIRP